MLLSRTYRRSSEPSDELLASDPYNRLHGRQTMARIEAEFIRDNALAVSGLLNRELGGPSVKPYQPADYYKELNFPKRVYDPDLNPNQFRRGLYTHWQRQYLHPALMAFDAPPREECAAERAVSNTPVQSLVLLNDPSYVEAARGFAARMLAEGGKERPAGESTSRSAKLSRALRCQRSGTFCSACLSGSSASSPPTPSRAEELLKTGISRLPRRAEPTELAAWTSVARALFNKHEFLMKY